MDDTMVSLLAKGFRSSPLSKTLGRSSYENVLVRLHCYSNSGKSRHPCNRNSGYYMSQVAVIMKTL